MGDLDVVDASNTARFPENQAASSVNNGARALEGIIARWYNDINGTVDAGGTANALTLAANQTISAYADGMFFRFTAASDNTDFATLNVDSVGAKDILLSNQSALTRKALISNGVHTVVYKATEDCFYLLDPSNGDMPRNGIDGLIMSNGSDTLHDIDVSVGIAMDVTNKLSMPLNTAMTKRIDAAWAAGTGNGGYGSVSGLAADTWYHVHLIYNSSTTAPAVDIGFDASITATQLLSDSGYTRYRRIGSVLTNGSSNIVQFIQVADDFFWDVPFPTDVSTANPGASQVTATLTVPDGLSVNASIVLDLVETANGNIRAVLVSSLDIANTAPTQGNAQVVIQSGANASSGASGASAFHVRTDTSQQIRYRAASSAASFTVTIGTLGWRDYRGKDG